MDKNRDKLDSLVESIGQLMSLNDAENDGFAAGLYCAMFHHETDLHVLDYNYADHILGYAEMGCENAIEDYKNYLQYIKTIYPLEYPEYAKMLENALNPEDEEEQK